jgi:hypothetical protein
MNLLQDNRLILFCGAGISRPAGLPDFRTLVDDVYQRLGQQRTEVEQEAFNAKFYDRVLGLLEARVISGGVRHAVMDRLAASPDADISMHRALLKLARLRTGGLRLVTTNFDNLFEQVADTTLNFDAAPRLPTPKKRWRTLVYLHGRLDRSSDPDGMDLVLTAADFGTAYLVEGWASKFVTELFRRYAVLFVGYSVDDPVMRYLVDAVAAERVRGESFGKAFAVAAHGASDRQAIETAWRAKGVEPILYHDRDDHLLLRQTLEEWARLHAGGLTSRGYLVKRYASEEVLNPGDEVAARVVWAISEPSGCAARQFASMDPTPPFSWHSVLDAAGLFSLPLPPTVDGEGREQPLRSPLVDDGAFVDRLLFPPVTYALAQWLTHHMNEPTLLSWILQRGGVVHGRARDVFRKALPTLPEPLRTLWDIVLSEAYCDRHVDFGSLLQLREQIRAGAWSPTNRIELRRALKPVPRIALRNQGVLTSCASVGDLAQIEVDLMASRSDALLLDDILKSPAREAILAGIAEDVTDLLNESLDWFALFGRANEDDDPSWIHLPSIAPDEHNFRYHGWTRLIILARECVQALMVVDGRKARVLLDRWGIIPYPTFRRLILHTVTDALL